MGSEGESHVVSELILHCHNWWDQHEMCMLAHLAIINSYDYW